MGYMKKMVAEIISHGYALDSIDYRFSTQAVFPAQARDCNRAISYLYDHADKYGIDRERFALVGLSEKSDPLFLIIHGEKDAPHFGAMFDADQLRKSVMDFLNEHLN
jgi:BD-FAE